MDKPHWNRYTAEVTADCGGPTMEQVQALKGLVSHVGPSTNPERTAAFGDPTME